MGDNLNDHQKLRKRTVSEVYGFCEDVPVLTVRVSAKVFFILRRTAVRVKIESLTM